MHCVTFTACILAVLGCRSEDKPKPPPPPVDGIEVIAQGAEPRRLLRYALASGTTLPFELAMDVELQTVDAAVKVPTIAMSIDITVATVAADSANMKMTVVAAGARAR